jgi:SAM-dependent methyltransferase
MSGQPGKGAISSVGLGTEPSRAGTEGSEWFWEHFDDAANQIIDFLGGDGLELKGKEVADIGAGDGITDLGVFLKTRPNRLVGFDIEHTDTDHLVRLASREAVADELPDGLEFRRSEPIRLPASDDSFDIIFSWSAFEHVSDPPGLLREIHRVLRPQGVLMIQIWPFFHSRHGSHLWQYFPEGFVQLLRDDHEIEAQVRARPGADREWAEQMLDGYRSCNRVTLDGLHAALRASRFRVSKLELLTEAFHVPPALSDLPLSLLGVSGVKLLATPVVPPGP